MALDNFLVQDPFGRPFDDADQLERLKIAIEDALANRGKLVERLKAQAAAAHARRSLRRSSPMC